MSVINSALTDIADKKASSLDSDNQESNNQENNNQESSNRTANGINTLAANNMTKANIPHVRQSNKLVWAVGGFVLSLGVGSWAVSQQEVLVNELQQLSLPVTTSLVSGSTTSPTTESVLSVSEQRVESSTVTQQNLTSSPTVSLASTETIQLYPNGDNDFEMRDAEMKSFKEIDLKATTGEANVQQESAAKVIKMNLTEVTKAKVTAVAKTTAVSNSSSKPAHVVAQVAVAPKKTALGEIAVEQVELSPNTLSANAIERGKKALDSNELSEAIQEFENAIKYQPNDDETRKRLAALYYGKKDIRRSVEVLQQGIRLNESSQGLRIALAKVLIKEGQAEAALSPLVYLPSNVNIDYLELRAALSQQVKNQEIATETYQILTQRAPDNARWWLGLAIQQERALEYQKAYHSYQAAINKVGVSKQTQAFIRERLTLLKDLQGE